MSKANHPYAKPVQPRNSLELLRWVVMEPNRVKRYEQNVEKKSEQVKVFLKAYGTFCLLFIPFWILSQYGIAYFNVPELFADPEAIFKEDFWQGWTLQMETLDKFWFLITYTYKGLAFGLALGLALGLAGGLAVGLALGLAFGLAGGLAFGLAFGFAKLL